MRTTWKLGGEINNRFLIFFEFNTSANHTPNVLIREWSGKHSKLQFLELYHWEQQVSEMFKSITMSSFYASLIAFGYQDSTIDRNLVGLKTSALPKQLLGIRANWRNRTSISTNRVIIKNEYYSTKWSALPGNKNSNEMIVRHEHSTVLLG